MRKIFFAVAVCFIIAISAKSQNNIIVSPQWLNDNMQDQKIVIVQPSFLKLDYENEHIKGARYLWPDWLTASSPEGTYNPPDPKADS
jgi:3-mercaptopyruvate sulfurtransferase SseA